MYVAFSAGRLRACLAAALAVLFFIAAASDASASPVRVGTLDCLDDATVVSLKRNPEQVFPGLYESCSPQLRAMLGDEFANLSDSAMKFVFASATAFRMSYYGASTIYDLRGLAALPSLDCAGYAALTWHLARVAGADVRYARVVGWDGSPIGNHAQLYYQEPGNDLMLDATIGLIARISVPQVVAGQGIRPEIMFQFLRPPVGPSLSVFNDMVTGAIHVGQFTASSMIYNNPYPPGQGSAYQTAVANLEVADQAAKQLTAAEVAPAPAPVQAAPADPASAPAPVAPAKKSKHVKKRDRKITHSKARKGSNTRGRMKAAKNNRTKPRKSKASVSKGD